MPRRSPLPSAREVLIDLLGQVNRFLDHHVGTRFDLDAMVERGLELDPSLVVEADYQFAILAERVVERQRRGYPPAHGFAEYLDFPFELDDVDGPGRLVAFWEEIACRGPMALDETTYGLAKNLQRDLMARLEDVGSRDESSQGEEDDLVTLDQAAAMAHTSKRTLERHKTRGTLPDPAVDRGSGRSHLYSWREMAPWLETEFGVKQPSRFPASRRRPTST
jgi:hypothetical protein